MRNKQIDNAIDNIETVKLYQWEDAFKNRINKFTEEIDYHFYSLKINGFLVNLPYVLFDKITPFFIFTFVAWLDMEMKHANIVEVIYILATLSTDLKQIPHYFPEAYQCLDSYRKLYAFLNLDEIQATCYKHVTEPDDEDENAIELKGNFSYGIC